MNFIYNKKMKLVDFKFNKIIFEAEYTGKSIIYYTDSITFQIPYKEMVTPSQDIILQK